ncbi:MAG: Flp family type IVb pilin [Microthrixaceae bacterium]
MTNNPDLQITEPRTEDVIHDSDEVLSTRTASASSESAPRSRMGRRVERGASLVEYALLIVLIALALFSAVGTLGQDVGGKLTNTHNVISASTGTSG